MADPDIEQDRIARLRLIRTASIGPVTYRQLVRRFGDARAALAAVPDLARRGGGKPPAIASEASVRAEVATVEALGARYLFQGLPGYPALLAEIDDAPPVLIAHGRARLLDLQAVAIVGARNASAGAVRFARGLAHDLAEAGLVVVSGLARGIDTGAHQGALDRATIAVVAGGADIFYPPENEALQRAIAERGLVLAEQPPGTEPRARHFPYRNRIIAGLSLGTVVVEAAPKSGSLITARQAANQGREVMAVPGSPLDGRAQGCNQLIRDGATLVQSADDVIESIGGIGGASLRSPRQPYEPAPAEEASEAERRTLIDLLGPSAVPIDELIRQSGLSSAVVQTILLELELAGRLERHAGARVGLI